MNRPGVRRRRRAGSSSDPLGGDRAESGRIDGRSAGGRGSTTRYSFPSGGRRSGSSRFGHAAIARSAIAVIVNDGLTPRLAPMAAPSMTWRPGCPNIRWYGSTTPVARVAPTGAPPEDVRGGRHVEQHLVGETSRDTIDDVGCDSGRFVHDGDEGRIGRPRPCREARRVPNQPFLRKTCRLLL